VRRIVLRLARPTRHGDAEIVCLTNVPPAQAGATLVMQLYRERWQVEGLFLSVTQNFDGEIKTLAYPQAALFSFTLALMAYNSLATLKAALASVHGVGQIEAALSDFYVVDELQGTYRGMMIAIPPHLWPDFADMPVVELADFLQDLAAKVYLKRFLKAPPQNYQVAQSQNWRCPVCQDALFNGEALHTHHLKPVKEGGTDLKENLIHLHQACHHHLHKTGIVLSG
jgi:hypothetical protein